MGGGAGGGDVEADLPARDRGGELLTGGFGLLREERSVLIDDKAGPILLTASVSVFTLLMEREDVEAALGATLVFVFADAVHGSFRAMADHSGWQMVSDALAASKNITGLFQHGCLRTRLTSLSRQISRLPVYCLHVLPADLARDVNNHATSRKFARPSQD